MRKLLIVIISILCVLCLVGCSNNEKNKPAKEEGTETETVEEGTEKQEEAEPEETVEEEPVLKREAEINGVVYGLDDLGDMDFETSLAWVKAVYGEGNYTIDEGFGGYDLIFVHINDGMTCEEMRKLAWGLREKGYVSVLAKSNKPAAQACGLA